MLIPPNGAEAPPEMLPLHPLGKMVGAYAIGAERWTTVLLLPVSETEPPADWLEFTLEFAWV